MIGNKKVIGVCMTKMHNTTRSRNVSYLYEELRRRGHNLIVFNNSFDYFDPQDGSVSDRIFELINFSIIDALVIFCSCFAEKEVYRKVADKAREHNIPVILEDDSYEGCITVRNAFEPTFEALINHVINDHGARDTFFIAGLRGNEYSEMRLEVYKKVLRDNGLIFTDDMVDYGDFWAWPTNDVIDRYIKSGKKLPQAFICANDAMAIAAAERLAYHGYKVPEDIIVTGFDGSKMSEFTKPKISTCVIDMKKFAKLAAETIDVCFEGGTPDSMIECGFSLRLADSCGCCDENRTDFRALAEENYTTALNMIGHEHYVFNQIHAIMNSGGMDINTFYSAVSGIMQETSLLALDPQFLSGALGQDYASSDAGDELVTITSGKLNVEEAARRTHFRRSDMIPEKEAWARDDSAYIINQVQVGNVVCGYYECVTNNIVESAQVINRVLNLVNMIIHMATSDLRQRFFKFAKNDEAIIDPVTELASLHGATVWYDRFVQRPESGVMTLSIYEIPRYRYIYEKYGLSEIEALLCFTAEALRIANPHNSFIARISENQFIVINWYNDSGEIAPVINNATTVFYGLLGRYNRDNSKDYYIEITAGCTYTKKDKLEACIHDAINEMYKNKLIYGTKSAVKAEITTTGENYSLFNALIVNNLFCYHFQPIVRADTGEIYAYEALMRTDKTIGFNPLEVLSIAAEYDRLDEIERATLFNVMERVKNEKAAFGDRKVFVNCIPGHFIGEEDNKALCDKYSDIIGSFVFEITEQDTVTAEELDVIRSIANAEGTNPIAVDDYGVGHSNVVNLINYAPQIVKIDRFLMTDIHIDETKQLVVQSVIDFAKKNRIKVLAEGIETADELRKVIELGVDYIQGYYTGRPAPEPLDEIAPEVKAVILDAAAKRTVMQDSPLRLLDYDERLGLNAAVSSLRAKGVSAESIVEIIRQMI